MKPAEQALWDALARLAIPGELESNLKNLAAAYGRERYREGVRAGQNDQRSRDQASRYGQDMGQ